MNFGARVICRSAVWLGFLLAFPPAATGSEWDVAVSPSPPGPILVAIRTSSTDAERRHTLVRVDPLAPTAVEEVASWTGNAEVQARLTRDRLLVERWGDGGLYVLDLATGTTAPVLEEGKTSLLRVVDGRLLFWWDHVVPEIGFALERVGDTARVASGPAPRRSLWSVPADGSAPPVSMGERVYAHQLASDGAATFVLTADRDPELVEVPAVGAPRRIASLGTGFIPSMISAAVSPDGASVAIGLAPETDFFGKRDLVVLERATGEEQLRLQGIECRVSRMSSVAPSLDLAWLDARTVRFSESVLDETGEGGFFQRVDVDVTTGERVAESPYTTRLRMYHQAVDAEPFDPARFRFEGRTLRWSADDEAGLDLTGAETLISPSGRWLVVRSDRLSPSRRLFDGETRAMTALPDDLVSFQWLPSAE